MQWEDQQMHSPAAIQLNPTHIDAHDNKGILWKMREGWKMLLCVTKKQSDWTQVLQMHITTKVLLLRVIARQEGEGALECYEEAIRLDPSAADAHYYKGPSAESHCEARRRRCSRVLRRSNPTESHRKGRRFKRII
eukprot:TRINITY_DN3118_c0_g2_i2.p1 TRINITY_DN3118_c0_g2~~TRINITY_DN3118_c0_g2_i2.p1  ORF type:complete len:136 (+),score=24.23 TRINITY_DN3118_c0_g2_i2:98-505(+)